MSKKKVVAVNNPHGELIIEKEPFDAGSKLRFMGIQAISHLIPRKQ